MAQHGRLALGLWVGSAKQSDNTKNATPTAHTLLSYTAPAPAPPSPSSPSFFFLLLYGSGDFGGGAVDLVGGLVRGGRPQGRPSRHNPNPTQHKGTMYISHTFFFFLAPEKAASRSASSSSPSPASPPSSSSPLPVGVGGNGVSYIMGKVRTEYRSYFVDTHTYVHI